MEGHSASFYFLGYSIPKQEVVFFSQMLIIYVVIIVGLVNISLGNGDVNLWLNLVTSCICYLLPNPSLRNLNQSRTILEL